MSDDANVRIAKVLGFGIHDVSYWAKYDEDLNLMHRLEEGLTDDEFREYRDALWTITLGHARPYERHHISATAAQRAEAYVKVKER